MAAELSKAFGETPSWEPARPHLRLRHLLVAWVTAALAVYVAAWLVPGVHAEGLLGAFAAAALIALLNALLPPLDLLAVGRRRAGHQRPRLLLDPAEGGDVVVRAQEEARL